MPIIKLPTHAVRYCLLIAAALAAMVPACRLLAQEEQIAQAEQSKATELLRQSVQAIDAAKDLSCVLSVDARVVMGEKTQETNAAYMYAKREDGRFFFRPNLDTMRQNQDGIEVRGNGKATLTFIPALGRYMIEPSTSGITAFVRSPLAQGVGNGFGSLGLSVLSLETVEGLIEEISAAEYLGEQQEGDQTLHQCRYTLNEITFDVWFNTGETPLPVRFAPDLQEIAARDPAAQQFDNFEYSLAFNFKDWTFDRLEDDQYAMNEPEGSEIVKSFFERESDGAHPLLGAEAPAVELKNLEGDAINLADHLGKDIVLLDFWATWCPPCVAAMPKIDQVAEAFADQGVVFYAVNQQEAQEKVAEFLESKSLHPPVLLDDGQLGNAYLVESLPTTVMIGKDGKVQVVHVGIAEPGETMEEVITNFGKKLTQQLDALIAGEDLAAAIVTQREQQRAKDVEEFARLRELLNN